MPDAFYLRDGDRFVATELTRGPWDPEAQHAGPPAALVGRQLERLGGDGWQLGRITFEILRSIPIAPLTVSAEVARPGRSVELVEATLAAGGEPVVRARAWRVRAAEVALPAAVAAPPAGDGRPPGPAPPPPQAGEPKPFFPTGQAVGYHTAMEHRFVAGSFLDPGPATTWFRMRHPLVAGEQPSPLVRTLIAADTANGISAALDYRRYLFINVDLTVHLHRLPAGEWVCLEARTIPEPKGIGLSEATLHDPHGPLGRALQTLLVRERTDEPTAAGG